MRIAIDIRRVTDFGVGTYIRNIVRALAALGSGDDFFLLGPERQFAEFDALPANFTPVPFDAAEESPRSWMDFGRALRHVQVQVVHVPHLFWYPRRPSCPYVVTVHDLLMFCPPANARPSWKRVAQDYFTRRALRKAAHILAVSRFTRNEILRLLSVREGKISVVYNAIDERFRRGHATPAERAMIAQRYQVTYPFLLYVGNVKAHKNVARLIEAFSVLKAELQKEGALPDLRLIIIGDELSKHPDLRRTVVKGAVQNEVRFLGFVPIDVLRVFYDAAQAFVFPSLYEGFGLPPLEAMAHGTPVVSSTTTALPEVLGNAALLVNPENVFEITRALYRVLLDQPLRSQLIERGYQQAGRFSWEVAAQQTLAAYYRAAS